MHSKHPRMRTSEVQDNEVQAIEIVHWDMCGLRVINLMSTRGSGHCRNVVLNTSKPTPESARTDGKKNEKNIYSFRVSGGEAKTYSQRVLD